MRTIKIVKQMNSETKMVLLYFIFHEISGSVSFFSEITKRNIKNVSKQLNELEKSGILSSEVKGREKYFVPNKDLSNEWKEIIKSISKQYYKDPSKCGCINDYNERKGKND